MLTEEIADAFVACLEEGRYYDAHEVLEALWFPRRFEKDPEVLLLKGMINAAVSFELRKRGRNERARVPWRTYEKYRAFLRSGIPSPYFRLDTEIQVHRPEEMVKA